MRSTVFLFLFLSACPGVSVVSGGADKGDAADTDPGADDTETLTPMVKLLSPETGATVDNPVTFTLSAEGVAAVGLDADGYALSEPWDPAEGTSLAYSFNGTGYVRTITLTGYDALGAVVATDSITLTVADPTEDTVQIDAPYFYQYDNVYDPGSTYGITSGAMMVDTFHPGSVTPDSLYLSYGKAQGQSPSGLAALYEAEGLYADWTTSGTRAQIRANLDAGRPVAVHGWWTSAGHVTLIIGYDAEDWIVNDPAGDWYDCYGCGEAPAVHYPVGGDWDALMSTDGDLWWSTASASAF